MKTQFDINQFIKVKKNFQTEAIELPNSFPITLLNPNQKPQGNYQLINKIRFFDGSNEVYNNGIGVGIVFVINDEPVLPSNFDKNKIGQFSVEMFFGTPNAFTIDLNILIEPDDIIYIYGENADIINTRRTTIYIESTDLIPKTYGTTSSIIDLSQII